MKYSVSFICMLLSICCAQAAALRNDEQRPLKWGLASTGKIVHEFATALGTLNAEDHQLVVVAAHDLGRTEEFEKKFNVTKAYGSYLELAQDSQIHSISMLSNCYWKMVNTSWSKSQWVWLKNRHENSSHWPKRRLCFWWKDSGRDFPQRHNIFDNRFKTEHLVIFYQLMLNLDLPIWKAWWNCVSLNIFIVGYSMEVV